MTERRAGVAEVMKYVIFAVIIGLCRTAADVTSGSSRSFDEVADSVRVSAGHRDAYSEMNDQALKRNFGLNSADYDGVLYYAAESSMSAEEVLLIKVKSDDPGARRSRTRSMNESRQGWTHLRDMRRRKRRNSRKRESECTRRIYIFCGFIAGRGLQGCF